jgi:hypothetical protein
MSGLEEGDFKMDGRVLKMSLKELSRVEILEKLATKQIN